MRNFPILADEFLRGRRYLGRCGRCSRPSGGFAPASAARGLPSRSPSRPCSSRSNCFSPRRALLAAVQTLLAGRGAIFAALVPLFAVLVYSFGVTGDWKTMLVGAAYAVLPRCCWSAAAGKSPGTWEDYAAALLIWLPRRVSLDVPRLPLSAAADAHAHDSDGAQHRRRGVRSAAPPRRHRLRRRMAAGLRLEFRAPLRGVRRHRDSARDEDGISRTGRRRSRARTLCRSTRSAFCSSPRGRRNFCFAECCRICSHEPSRISGRDWSSLR